MGTDLELIHTEETPIYHRLPGEPLDAYEAFVEWCKIPRSSRNLGNFLRRTAYPQKLTRKLMADWKWEDRATAFDNDSLKLRPDPTSMDEEAALAGQMAAATLLIEMGMNGLQTKNLSLLPAGTLVKILEKGVEIQRRALGQADLNVQFTVDDMTRVNKLFAEFGDDFVIEDAQVITEPDLTSTPETADIEHEW